MSEPSVGGVVDREQLIAVVGAGTMGVGIAGLACRSGFPTVLCDADELALAKGRRRIHDEVLNYVARRRMTDGDALVAMGRLRTRLGITAELADAWLVVEAVPERPELKIEVLRAAASTAQQATIASNTSSLPISELARGLDAPERLIGLHFFNPPGVMKLVELIMTPDSARAHARRGREVVEAMGKRVVTVPDGPGFLVNRCARPYYLEALRIVEQGDATPLDVDSACVDAGFPMGPFRLMDAIGLDVSLAVTRAMYEQSDCEPRWQPSPIQERMVAAGKLGEKTGEGFYAYERACSAAERRDAAAVPARKISERIAAQLVNEAWFAIDAGIAAPNDIDTAMMLALRYPRGPWAWGHRMGLPRVVELLDVLAGSRRDPRYRVATGLRDAARAAQLPDAPAPASRVDR